MIDLNKHYVIIVAVDREDKARQRCTLIARSMPEERQEYVGIHILLSLCLSFGLKAKNHCYCDESAITVLNNQKYPSSQTYVYISVAGFKRPLTDAAVDS